MSDEQINAAITEAIDADPHWKCAKDYCNDLNAMHEGERSLNSQHMQDYTLNLLRVTNNDGTRFHGTLGCFAHVHATARQRAEAFLRTLGKWEGAK
jgi:hypothetical protein